MLQYVVAAVIVITTAIDDQLACNEMPVDAPAIHRLTMRVFVRDLLSKCGLQLFIVDIVLATVVSLLEVYLYLGLYHVRSAHCTHYARQ